MTLIQVDHVEKQLEVAEVVVTRRRSTMITMQERSDAKEENLRTTKIHIMKMDENNKRNSFIEDLEEFEDNDTMAKINDRSQLSFADILKLSKNNPKVTSYPNKKASKSKVNDQKKYFAEFQLLKNE